MEKVQGWLQENLGVILGVCVGVAVIEVWVPSPPTTHPVLPPTRFNLLCRCPGWREGLVEAHRLLEAPWQAWPDPHPSQGPLPPEPQVGPETVAEDRLHPGQALCAGLDCRMLLWGPASDCHPLPHQLLGMFLSMFLCRRVHSEDYSKVPKY